MSVYIRRWGDVMSTLLLRLAGPMQSWGVESKFEVRRSGTEPSKSAVIGLIAAAMGRRRDSSLDDLNQLMFGVRVDQPGVIQRDFQMVKNEKTSYLTYRYYQSVMLRSIRSAYMDQLLILPFTGAILRTNNSRDSLAGSLPSEAVFSAITLALFLYKFAGVEWKVLLLQGTMAEAGKQKPQLERAGALECGLLPRRQYRTEMSAVLPQRSRSLVRIARRLLLTASSLSLTIT